MVPAFGGEAGTECIFLGSVYCAFEDSKRWVLFKAGVDLTHAFSLKVEAVAGRN